MGVLVGDPIYFTVLKHLYHFKTEILFKDLQNNFYTKNNFVQGAPIPSPPTVRTFILFFDKKFGWVEDPVSLFRQCPKF